MSAANRSLTLGAATFATLAATQAAFAHAGHDHGAGTLGSLMAGLEHPIFGLDHLLAMIASGLLAVRAGSKRALWIVPASFAGLMIVGGLAALAGVPLPGAEWGIALSVVVLGLLVAVTPKMPTAAGVAIVGLFAICHGHAHVAELGANTALPYMAGFVASTLALHAAAIAIGLAAMKQATAASVRIAGGAIAATFALLLLLGL